VNATTIQFKYPVEPGLVSVIIPTYNRASILERAVTSALHQTYRQLEVVIVDDGSTDDTRAVVERMGARVTYVYQANAGVAAARNTAMAFARGEYVAFLDSDDAWLDWKIEAQVAGMRAHPEVGLVWTDMAAIGVEGTVVHPRYLRQMYGAYQQVQLESVMRRTGALAELMPGVPAEVAAAPVLVGDLSSEILLGNLLHTPTVLLRREWVERSGGLDASWGNGGEDYEYYTRLCAEGLVLLIDAPSILYRIGADDQLTAPEKMLKMAHNNLRTVRARVADRIRIALPPATMQRRMAWSLEWVGNEEFEAGRRGAAARHLASSLRTLPGVDRRLLLLALCALPLSVIDWIRVARRRVRKFGSHPEHVTAVDKAA
jgi:glycosyltransferase involved in cell wall biosynthesis